MAGEFVLVTKSRFEQMKNLEKKLQTQPEETTESMGDNPAKTTLEPSSFPKEPIEPPSNKPTGDKSDTPPSVKESKEPNIQEEIEQLVSKHPHLGTLFNIFSQHPETLKWNENGTIVIDGEKNIFGSDIIDLVEHTVTNKSQPIGKMAFYRAMAKLKVPSKLITHPKSKQVLVMMKKPPSKPIKRLGKSTPAKTGWITW